MPMGRTTRKTTNRTARKVWSWLMGNGFVVSFHVRLTPSRSAASGAYLEREVVIVVSHRRSHDLDSVHPSIHPRNTRLPALTRQEFLGKEVMLKALHEHRRYVADIASPAPYIVVVQHACRRPLPR